MTLARSRVSEDASWALPGTAASDACPPSLDADAASAPRATATGNDAWGAYWTTLPFRSDLCGLEAEDFMSRLATVVALQRDWRVLDFGCGFGMIAALLARNVREVVAWDPIPSMRAWTERNVADRGNVQIVAAASDRRLVGDAEPYDLIVVNSVMQYM